MTVRNTMRKKRKIKRKPTPEEMYQREQASAERLEQQLDKMNIHKRAKTGTRYRIT